MPFPEPSWKITKENEISLDPMDPKGTKSLNIIKGLQTLNKSLTRIEGSRKAEWCGGVGGRRGAGGETASSPLRGYTGNLWICCVFVHFSVLWLRFPGCSCHTRFCFFLSGFTPFNAPRHIASMCVSALCFLPAGLL